jgi:hypothetical protein
MPPRCSAPVRKKEGPLAHVCMADPCCLWALCRPKQTGPSRSTLDLRTPRLPGESSTAHRLSGNVHEATPEYVRMFEIPHATDAMLMNIPPNGVRFQVASVHAACFFLGQPYERKRSSPFCDRLACDLFQFTTSRWLVYRFPLMLCSVG